VEELTISDFQSLPARVDGIAYRREAREAGQWWGDVFHFRLSREKASSGSYGRGPDELQSLTNLGPRAKESRRLASSSSLPTDPSRST